MTSGDISVIIPCFKCSRTIKRALTSVLNQTLLPREIIIFDDGSKDETPDVINDIIKNQKHIDIRFIISPANLGVANARNRMWDVARFEYIAFLDADDSWHPNKLEIQYNVMKNNKHIVLSGHHIGNVSLREKCEIFVPISNSLICRRISKNEILRSNRYATSSVMLKRALPFRFPENQRYSEDYQLWAKILLNNYECIILDMELAYRYKPEYGHSGLSGKLWEMEKGELMNYYCFYKEGRIGIWGYLFLTMYSFFKYIKRILRTAIYEN